jgi:dihydrodipicolinate synthase/N-acetylneuraminate lyase
VHVQISKKGLTLLKKINSKDLDAPMRAITEEEAKTVNKILDKIRN